MFNVLTILVPPVLIVISIPLAVLATITTVLACSGLFIRVSILYFELGLALISSWLFVARDMRHSTTASKSHQTPHPDRRGSASKSPLTAQEPRKRQHLTTSDSSLTMLFAGSAPNRDFEGVGGWRTLRDDEEELWMGMNSMLELPNVGMEQRRRHQRSLTAGSQRWSSSPDAVRISPIQSRARTPTALGEHGVDGYFMVQPHARMTPAIEGYRHAHAISRRQSTSARSIDSGSSNASSSALTMKGRETEAQHSEKI